MSTVLFISIITNQVHLTDTLPLVFVLNILDIVDGRLQ